MSSFAKFMGHRALLFILFIVGYFLIISVYRQFSKSKRINIIILVNILHFPSDVSNRVQARNTFRVRGLVSRLDGANRPSPIALVSCVHSVLFIPLVSYSYPFVALYPALMSFISVIFLPYTSHIPATSRYG